MALCNPTNNLRVFDDGLCASTTRLVKVYVNGAQLTFETCGSFELCKDELYSAVLKITHSVTERHVNEWCKNTYLVKQLVNDAKFVGSEQEPTHRNASRASEHTGKQLHVEWGCKTLLIKQIKLS